MRDEARGTGEPFWKACEGERALQRCQSLVDTFSDGIFRLDADDRLDRDDGGFLDLSGYSREDLLGEHVSVLLAESDATRIDDVVNDDHETDPGDASDEIAIVTADGDRVPCELHVDRLENDGEFGGTVCVVRDVTERRADRRALEETAQRYRALVENFPNGTVNMFDEELRYTTVGGQLLEDLEIEPDDRLGRRIPELYPDAIVEQVEPYFRAALRGEVNDFEIEFQDRYLQAHTLPVGNGDDGVDGGMLVVRDITERKEDQRRLEESERCYRTLVEHFANGGDIWVDSEPGEGATFSFTLPAAGQPDA